MPEGVAILDRLGVLDAVLAHGARRFRGLRFRSPEGVWAEAEFPGTAPHPEYGLVLPRRELDHVLFERARETPGVEARDGFRVHSLRMQGDRIEGITGARVRGAGAPVRDPGAQESFAAALTIGADGIHSLFHRACGLNRSLLRRRRFGITGHFTGITDRADHVEVLVQPRGELYVAPGPGDLTLVALLLEARAMRDFRHDLPAPRRLLPRAGPEPLRDPLGR